MATSTILAYTSIILLIAPSLQQDIFRPQFDISLEDADFVKRQGGFSENAMSQILEKLDAPSNLRKQMLARKFWK